MKKTKILILAILVILSLNLMAQIPNAGFETWTGNDPNGWDNLNSLTSLTGTYTCTKGTPGNPGASYLKLITKSVIVVGIVPGIALSGKLDKTTFQPTSGFAYNQRPTALTGNWQYMAYGNDQGFIAVAFTKWNTITNSRDTISTTMYSLPGMVMSWESFNIPITFTSPSNPDTCLIVLSASGLSSAVANSYLYIDNLDFSFGTSIKENDITKRNIKIYPNPLQDELRFELPDNLKSSTISYKLINNLGLTIQSSNNHQSNYIETSNLPSGFYQLIIESKGKQYISKCIKK
ncbi:MAG: T9SS type A sorting domain-containing protein [Bacteroidetes bacterium]|nr:T9SS type A sorting domain-containing protein [Bacteroidota bacterium]